MLKLWFWYIVIISWLLCLKEKKLAFDINYQCPSLLSLYVYIITDCFLIYFFKKTWLWFFQLNYVVISKV